MLSPNYNSKDYLPRCYESKDRVPLSRSPMCYLSNLSKTACVKTQLTLTLVNSDLVMVYPGSTVHIFPVKKSRQTPVLPTDYFKSRFQLTSVSTCGL